MCMSKLGYCKTINGANKISVISLREGSYYSISMKQISEENSTLREQYRFFTVVAMFTVGKNGS